MSTYYKLRVDTQNLDLIESILKKYSSKYIVSLENEGTENTHSHSYIETTEKQATIRNVLRKTFGSGNSSYSLKELDEEKPVEYLAYVIKDKNYRHNMNQEDIEKAKEYDKQVKDQIKEKKLSRKTQIQKIEEKYFTPDKLHIVSNSGYESKQSWTEEQVLEVVIQYYKEEEILIREFQLISLTQTLSLKYVPYYGDRLKSRILDRMTR